MDELDKLKQHWKANTDTVDKKLSKNDLYAMLRKNSSSILKTLFYISIIEFCVFSSLSLIPLFNSSYRNRLETVYANNTAINAITFLSIGVILLFVFLLYINYKSLSVTDNAKKLMENILKTIKTVRYYVVYNLALGFILMVSMYYQITHNDPIIVEKLANAGTSKWALFIGVMAISTLLFLAFVWLFYKLLYGKLIKKLKGNYNELLKLDN